MSDMAVILELPRAVIESFALFDDEKWRTHDKRAQLLLTFCLNAIAFFQGSCPECGISFKRMTAEERGRIDFHHLVEETKYFDLSRGKFLPSFIIIQELRKCVAMCKNCHSEETIEQHKAKRARRNSAS